MLLRNALEEACSSTWDYAVFWKLKRSSRMVLTWEEGYCNTAKGSSPSHTSFGTNDKKLHVASHEPSRVDANLLSVAVATMSYHIYSYGEGIVGRVAFVGKHQWVFSPECPSGGNRFTPTSTPRFLLSGSYARSHQHSMLDKYPAGWANQFEAGIRTIAVVSVPEGVLQLGSGLVIPEDLTFVNYVRQLFTRLQSIPGAFVSDLVPGGSSGGGPTQWPVGAGAAGVRTPQPPSGPGFLRALHSSKENAGTFGRSGNKFATVDQPVGYADPLGPYSAPMNFESVPAPILPQSQPSHHTPAIPRCSLQQLQEQQQESCVNSPGCPLSSDLSPAVPPTSARAELGLPNGQGFQPMSCQQQTEQQQQTFPAAHTQEIKLQFFEDNPLPWESQSQQQRGVARRRMPDLTHFRQHPNQLPHAKRSQALAASADLEAVRTHPLGKRTVQELGMSCEVPCVTAKRGGSFPRAFVPSSATSPQGFGAMDRMEEGGRMGVNRAEEACDDGGFNHCWEADVRKTEAQDVLSQPRSRSEYYSKPQEQQLDKQPARTQSQQQQQQQQQLYPPFSRPAPSPCHSLSAAPSRSFGILNPPLHLAVGDELSAVFTARPKVAAAGKQKAGIAESREGSSPAERGAAVPAGSGGSKDVHPAGLDISVSRRLRTHASHGDLGLFDPGLLLGSLEKELADWGNDLQGDAASLSEHGAPGMELASFPPPSPSLQDSMGLHPHALVSAHHPLTPPLSAVDVPLSLQSFPLPPFGNPGQQLQVAPDPFSLGLPSLPGTGALPAPPLPLCKPAHPGAPSLAQVTQGRPQGRHSSFIEESALASRIAAAVAAAAADAKRQEVVRQEDATAPGEGSEYKSKGEEGEGGGTPEKQGRSTPGAGGTKQRPRDRQLIQDRLQELRELLAGNSKMSIDGILDHTIRQVAHLRATTARCAVLVGSQDSGGDSVADTTSKTTWSIGQENDSEHSPCSVSAHFLQSSGCHMKVEILCHYAAAAQLLAPLADLRAPVQGLSLRARGGKATLSFVVQLPVTDQLSGHGSRGEEVMWHILQLIGSRSAAQAGTRRVTEAAGEAAASSAGDESRSEQPEPSSWSGSTLPLMFTHALTAKV